MSIELSWEDVMDKVPKTRLPTGCWDESSIVQHVKKTRVTTFRVGSLANQHLTRKRSERVGTFVAIKGKDGKVRIGWAKCWLKKKGQALDKFDPTFGKKLASARAVKQSKDAIPHSLIAPLRQFILRAQKYFGDDSLRCSGKVPKGAKSLFPKSKAKKKPKKKAKAKSKSKPRAKKKSW